MKYKVNTEIFEGPLDLLLSMVEKRKLYINDISLADVTNDFIEYVNSLKHLPLNEITEFLTVSATLILIKSKSLLPTLDLTQEEQVSVEELQNRLKQHKLFSDLSIYIGENFGKTPSFSKTQNKSMTSIFAPDESITKSSLYESILNVLQKMPDTVIKPKARVNKVISLEKVIENISKRMQFHIKMNFNDVCNNIKNKKDKIFVVVNFLAVLELVKQGSLHAKQTEVFSDIELRYKK